MLTLCMIDWGSIVIWSASHKEMLKANSSQDKENHKSSNITAFQLRDIKKTDIKQMLIDNSSAVSEELVLWPRRKIYLYGWHNNPDQQTKIT